MTAAWLVHGYFALNILLYGAIAARTTMRPGHGRIAAAGLTLDSESGKEAFG